MDLLPALMITIIPMTLNVAGIEYTKGLQLPIDKETKSIIQKDGIYHLTSKENALQIIQSGYLKASHGKLNNHWAKSKTGEGYADLVYMFAGKPNIFMLSKNMAHCFGDKSDGTFYAIKHNPSTEDLENYTQRYNDGAITYEGKLSLEDKNPKLVRFKLEKGKLIEIPLDADYKMAPSKKKTLRCAGLAGLVLSSTMQITCDLGKLVIKKSSRDKFLEYIRKYRLANKILNQYNQEKELVKEVMHSVSQKIAKKFGKNKNVALEMEHANNAFFELEKDFSNEKEGEKSRE